MTVLPDQETLQAAKEAATRLSNRVFTNIGGYADPQAVKELADLLDIICRAISDPYFLRKADHAKGWLPILFSARKHRQWGDDGGASVRHLLGQDVATLLRGLTEVETRVQNSKLN